MFLLRVFVWGCLEGFIILRILLFAQVIVISRNLQTCHYQNVKSFIICLVLYELYVCLLLKHL